MKVLTDTQLVKKAVNGDDYAFEELWKRYEYKIQGKIKKAVCNRADIEDVKQEVMIKLFNSLPGFEFRSKFSTWLYIITRTEIGQYFRKKKLTNRFVVNDEILTTVLEGLHDEMTPERQVESFHRLKLAQRALNRIPKHLRRCFIGHIAAKAPLKEIADQQRVTVMCVKCRVRRAKNMFSKRRPVFDFINPLLEGVQT